MPDLSTLILFSFAGFMLLITPGPAMIYVTAKSMDEGTEAGLISVLGTGIGAAVHVVAAAFGITAIFVTSITAFNILKYIGAAFLIYVGIKKLIEKQKDTETTKINKTGLSKIFYEGVMVNLLNPKTAMFFFALLPQFVSEKSGSVILQMLMLGLILVVIYIISYGIYALFIGKFKTFLQRNTKISTFQNKFAGIIYILLGITTAFAGFKKIK